MRISEILYQACCVILVCSTLLVMLFVLLNRKEETTEHAASLKKVLYFTILVTWCAVYFYNDFKTHKRKIKNDEITIIAGDSVQATLKTWRKAKQDTTSDTIQIVIRSEFDSTNR